MCRDQNLLHLIFGRMAEQIEEKTFFIVGNELITNIQGQKNRLPSVSKGRDGLGEGLSGSLVLC